MITIILLVSQLKLWCLSKHLTILLTWKYSSQENIFLRKVTPLCLCVFLCDSGANMGIYDILLGIFRLLIIIVIIIIITSWQEIYMRLCWKKQPRPLSNHVKGHFVCVKLYQRLFFVPSSLGMSNLYISCPINFRQYSRPFLSYFTLKIPLQQL